MRNGSACSFSAFGLIRFGNSLMTFFPASTTDVEFSTMYFSCFLIQTAGGSFASIEYPKSVSSLSTHFSSISLPFESSEMR